MLKPWSLLLKLVVMRGAAERVLGRRRTGVLVMFRAVPYWNR
jgi:hypothetical protein